MKKLIYFVPLLALAIACTPKVPKTVAVAPPPPPPVPQLNNFVDSVSYVIGSDMVKNLKAALPKDEVMFNNDMFKLGFDEKSAGKGRVSDEDAAVLMQAFSKKLQAYAQAEQKKEAAKAKEAAKSFFAENAKKEGVLTTATGLQYKVLTKGTGATPVASDRVEVHYEGRLISGDVFDSSYQRGETTTFGVSQVIRGWTEGLQLMSEGGKFQFYIPADLAYGERGSPPKIGPGETLIFDVELIKVIKN